MVLLVIFLGFLCFIGKILFFPTYTKQVSVYFLDHEPKHTRRWNGGVKELSPASWSAHILLEGKNVDCDITHSLYSALITEPSDKRVALLSYHHALFSDAIVCERLDTVIK